MSMCVLRRALPHVFAAVAFAAGPLPSGGAARPDAGPGRVSALSNRLANPEFDATIDSWNLAASSSGWSGDDADSCAASGSLRLADPISVGASQFVDLGAGIPLVGRIRVRLVTGSDVSASLVLAHHSDPGCFTWTGQYQTAPVLLQPGAWQTLELHDTTPPFNACTAIGVAADSAGTGDFEIELDRGFLGDPGELLHGDFEIGASCRWSSSVP